ncbi:MAG: vitamin K epoxide reductase family protein [Thermoprotei archaeon]
MFERTLKTIIVALALLGAAVSSYLLANTLDEKVRLVCSDTGFINCQKVTTSPYSHIFGIPVALLGLLWFTAIILFVLLTGRSVYSVALPVLWIIGVAFVGYLVFSELFLIGAICVYCTIVHITAVLTGPPLLKLSFSGD